jgi:outer membrane murein-binding lipoprotein Lpp
VTLRLSVLSTVIGALLLSGCDRQLANTRNEVWQLAFRTSQLQAALERCEVDAERLEAHASAWDEVFDAAAEWLDVERETIDARQAEGRKGLTEDAEVSCPMVTDALTTSNRAAKRWEKRVERRELCGWLTCE